MLLVGLGNPGERYARTRHNAGWLLLDQLAQEEGLTFHPSPLVRGEVAETTIGPCKVTLLKPLTFMNLSGEAAEPLRSSLGLPLTEVLVILDEVQLAVGKLKLSSGGSDGGHNGLKSLDHCFGSNEYGRLRIGVGPHPKGAMKGFVLSTFRADETALLNATLSLGIEAIRSWAAEGGDSAAFQKAMGAANQKARQPLEQELAARRQRASLPASAESEAEANAPAEVEVEAAAEAAQPSPQQEPRPARRSMMKRLMNCLVPWQRNRRQELEN